jgi:hypothetical protein
MSREAAHVLCYAPRRKQVYEICRFLFTDLTAFGFFRASA